MGHFYPPGSESRDPIESGSNPYRQHCCKLLLSGTQVRKHPYLYGFIKGKNLNLGRNRVPKQCPDPQRAVNQKKKECFVRYPGTQLKRACEGQHRILPN